MRAFLLLILQLPYCVWSECLGSVNCDDGFAAMGITCTFLENAKSYVGSAEESCNCSLSDCLQDNRTYAAPEFPDCTTFVNDDFDSRPCVALTSTATNSLIMRSGDALMLDGYEHLWLSSPGTRQITMEAGSALSIQSVRIIGSTITNETLFGGCVFVGAGSNFLATSTTFQNCEATSGGALAAWTGSHVFIRKSMFRANHARWYGGGLFLYIAANAQIDNSTFESTSSVTRGGCVYLDSSVTLTLRGSRMTGCNTGEGAVFFTQPDSTLEFIDSLAEGGTATRSGGVLISYGVVVSANSTFRDSMAYIFCGGLFIVGSGSAFYGEDVKFSALTSPYHNGAIIVFGFDDVVPPTFSLRRSTIEACTGFFSGGSVVVHAAVADIFEVTVTDGSGGLQLSSSTVTITRSLVEDVVGTTSGCLLVSTSVLTVIDSVLRRCIASRGGGILADGGSRIILRSVAVVGCVATTSSGGGVDLSERSVLDASSIFVANCFAAEDGGGIAASDDCRVSLGGASTLDGNTAAGSGGGIAMRSSELYVAPLCTFVVLTLDFSTSGAVANGAEAWLVKADRRGVGAYFDARRNLARLVPATGELVSLELCLEPGKYVLWTASAGATWGDGKWDLATTFGDIRHYETTRDDSAHPENVHGTQAASFEVIGDDHEGRSAHFTRNEASKNGGGICTFDGAQVITTSNVTMDGNLAIEGNGGAVYNGPLCTIEVLGMNATDNAALNGGALAFSTLSSATISASKVFHNVARSKGGALHAENVETLAIDDVVLANNVAGSDGGAIALDFCDAENQMLAKSLACSGNVALANGGALAVYASSLLLEGGMFLRNHALVGSGGAMSVVAGSTVEVAIVPACARVVVLVDWTRGTRSCSQFIEGTDWTTCDKYGGDRCNSLRATVSTEVCDGCVCLDSTLDAGAESYFELVADNYDVVQTGYPTASTIAAHEFCLLGNGDASSSAYRLIAHDTNGHGWFGNSIHVALFSLEEYRWVPVVEDFGFETQEGSTEFRVVAVPEKTRILHNSAGGGGGAFFHEAGVQPAGLENVDEVVGNAARYGNVSATPAISFKLHGLAQVGTLAVSPGIPFHASASMVDAYGQRVLTADPRVVDVQWYADVEDVDALGTRNTTLDGSIDFYSLSFIAVVGTTLSMYLTSGDDVVSTVVNISIVGCPPGWEANGNINLCSTCQANYYWYQGSCRKCVKGMSCDSDGDVPLEHRIVGPGGFLALEKGYHRASAYSRKPTLCDGGIKNPACPGGIESVGCDEEKNVLKNVPRCGSCQGGYFRRGSRCLSCREFRTPAAMAADFVIAIVGIFTIFLVGPLVVKGIGSSSLSKAPSEQNPEDIEASVRLGRALSKLQTKLKALFVAVQVWSILLFTAPMMLPDVSVHLLTYVNILHVAIPGACFTKRRFSIITNLLVWTIAPFALVVFCSACNAMVNLVRRAEAAFADFQRGVYQRGYYRELLNWVHVAHTTRQSRSSTTRQRDGNNSMKVHSRISDSRVALAVLVVVTFISYPPMAYVVLIFFATEEYDDPNNPNETQAYARFDLSLRAAGPKYNAYLVYAGICVVTHVVGIPFFFAVMLYRNRSHLDPVDAQGRRARIDHQNLCESRARCQAIADKRITDDGIQPLRPLWFVYLPEYYLFEVFELFRRMALTTIPTLMGGTPLTQVATATLIAFLSVRFYREVQPFLDEGDSIFFENIQWLTLILTMILLYIAADESAYSGSLGYAIISVFVAAVTHSTVLVVRDVRQEKIIVSAVKIEMLKLRQSLGDVLHNKTPSFAPREATPAITVTQGDGDSTPASPHSRSKGRVTNVEIHDVPDTSSPTTVS